MTRTGGTAQAKGDSERTDGRAGGLPPAMILRWGKGDA